MRWFFILVSLWFASSIGLRGQELRQGYLDTVKGFFRDWCDANKHTTNHFIADYNPSDSRRFNMKYLIDELTNSTDSRVIYHYKMTGKEDEYGHIEYKKSDSITLTVNEMVSIAEKLTRQNRDNFKFDSDFFPEHKFAENKYLDLLFQKRKFRDSFPGGIRSFSLPIFIYDGQFAAVFHVYMPCQQGGSQLIELYKREDGHWGQFGFLAGGDW